MCKYMSYLYTTQLQHVQIKCTHSKLNQFANGFCAVYPCSITAQGFITCQYIFATFSTSEIQATDLYQILYADLLQRSLKDLKKLDILHIKHGFLLGDVVHTYFKVKPSAGSKYVHGVSK